MQNQRGVHVLVVIYPAQGHINPLIQFAKRLASKGVKVTVATTPYTIKSIHANTISIEPISDGFDEGGFKQASSLETYLESFKTVGSTTLAELIVKFNNSGTPVSCIVYDSLLSWALDVAKEFGIYAAMLLTNSASVCSLYWQINQGRLTLPMKQEALAAPMPGLPSLGFSDLPSFLTQPAKHYAYLSLILDNTGALDKNDWVFCNSFEELERELVKALMGLWPVEMIGPLVPSFYLDHQIEGDTSYGASLWKQDKDQCLKWLDSKPLKSVVYVSFGSMSSICSKQFEEIAWGLKASNMPFLWVAKEFKDEQLLEFTDSVGERGLFVTWCNQLEVLAHQAVGCFVTHCGWNSTLEGLSLGVPMVCVPQWSDQPTNAKFLADVWKVGVRTKKDEGIVTREELEKCLREVMVGERNEEIKSNASKWKEHAKRAVSIGGSSDRKIDEFIAELGKSKDKKA
ncbi:UDP-glycosyltransferase 74B1-like [Durio zibethinus]|uniref:Glycosyltransferase n=1 Tax=Durio zibethinus TaxID=66656 RepID=A0A6P5Y5Q4_DURZI|nr:UDP-glycosyltransferase 74B1-like [Durio zibethinus]